MQTALRVLVLGSIEKPSDSGKAEAVTGNVPFHSLASQIQNLRGCPLWGGRKGGRKGGREEEVQGEVLQRFSMRSMRPW